MLLIFSMLRGRIQVRGRGAAGIGRRQMPAACVGEIVNPSSEVTMGTRTKRWGLPFILGGLVSILPGIALCGQHAANSAQKTAALQGPASYRSLQINNVFNYYGNNGDGSFNPFSEDFEGFEFLKGQLKHIFFEDGVVWGGFQGNARVLKVGGSIYRHGLQPGPILVAGSLTAPPQAADPNHVSNRIYRTRPDIGPSTNSTEALTKIESEELPYVARYEKVTSQDMLNSYLQDWREWPAANGAPFTDIDGDGRYDPAIDIPGEPGAAQTLWYVANDLDSTLTEGLVGSQPIGLEMQKTIWAYVRRSGALTTSIFSRTRLINKSGARLDSMFLGFWSDPDLGYAGDDAAGYDSLRSLGYVYNGSASDQVYGTAIPAAGFALMEGPTIPGGPTDTAMVGFHARPGVRNLPVTSFVVFWPTLSYDEPGNGPAMTTRWYRSLNGLVAASGIAFLDPITSQPTRFPVSGDPVTGIGFIDLTYGLQAGDRSMMMSTGPFGMAAGDTQEAVVVQVAAVADDRLSSITALRTAVDRMRPGFFDIAAPGGSTPPAPPPEAPLAFALWQNYPNPFNSSSIISAQWPVESRVRVTIYDMIGRQVGVLVDGLFPAGKYSFPFRGEKLATGVYLYRITAGSFSASRKLVLVK